MSNDYFLFAVVCSFGEYFTKSIMTISGLQLNLIGIPDVPRPFEIIIILFVSFIKPFANLTPYFDCTEKGGAKGGTICPPWV